MDTNNHLMNLLLPSEPSADTNVKEQPQYFDFTFPIMKYIVENPTGKAWKKLIQTCKFFFPKYPVYPIRLLTESNHVVWYIDGEQKYISNKLFHKFWLFDELRCYGSFVNADIISKLIVMVFKCDIKLLNISYQNISWNDYQILTSSGSLKYLNLFGCSLKYSDGTIVTMDKLFENIHSLEKFEFWGSPEFFQADAVKKMVKILSGIKKLRSFRLYRLKESFDITSFLDFILNNKSVDICLHFEYYWHPSDNYKRILNNAIKKIIINPPKMIPEICYYGFNGNPQHPEYQKLCRGEK